MIAQRAASRCGHWPCPSRADLWRCSYTGQYRTRFPLAQVDVQDQSFEFSVLIPPLDLLLVAEMYLQVPDGAQVFWVQGSVPWAYGIGDR